LRRPTNPTAIGGRASRFLGATKTQLAGLKTNVLTDIQIVVYTDGYTEVDSKKQSPTSTCAGLYCIIILIPFSFNLHGAL
jgi:hypothetical protein